MARLARAMPSWDAATRAAFVRAERALRGRAQVARVDATCGAVARVAASAVGRARSFISTGTAAREQKLEDIDGDGPRQMV
jgi:hypothetical protein